MMLRNRLLFQALLGAKRSQNAIVCRMQNARWSTAIAMEKESESYNAALANAKAFEEVPSFLMLPWLGTSWIYLPIIGRYSIREHHKSGKDKRQKLGDIFREKNGPMNLVISFNADDVQAIFNHEGPYPTRGEFQSLKVYRESRKDMYSTTGLLLLQGKEWHDFRSRTQKHLMKPKAIQAYLNPMQDVARDFASKISAARDSNKEVPHFLEELYKWALESVALVGLDTRLGCLDLNLSKDSDGMRMIESVQTQFDCLNLLEVISGNIPFWKIFPTPTWRRFTKACDVFTEIAFRHINNSLEELRQNAGKEDKEMTLLQSMVMMEGLDVSGAMVMVADMLTAGIDTTSHAVGFFLYHMAKNPEKQELLHQEIIKLMPGKEDRITNDIFNELKYLKACIKESHRLTPIVGGSVRVADHDVILSGYRIPAGTMLVVGLQEIYRDERYFSDPNQYLPDRWLSKEKKIHPFAFVPFGIGPRSCIGRRLAELEIISLLTQIIKNFKVTYLHEDIDMTSRLINLPDKPLRFNFLDR